MSPRVQSAGRVRPRRTGWKVRAGCLAYALVWIAILWVPEIIAKHLGWHDLVIFDLLLAGGGAGITAYRIHRRGQTIAEAVAASRADRRGAAERQLRHRAERQERARHEAALPWLHDQRRNPGELSGVVITPAVNASRHQPGGYDVLLDFPGDRQLEVIGQLRRLTRLSFAEAKDLLDTAPVPVLRVPDMPMAEAVKHLLESAGAEVSIRSPVPG